MSTKYIVTENFKSTEKDRKISFLNRVAKIVNVTVKNQTVHNEKRK